jgi:hypothetical protein
MAIGYSFIMVIIRAIGGYEWLLVAIILVIMPINGYSINSY